MPVVLKNYRVLQIIDFIEKFKVCDVTHIARLFYQKNKFRIQDAQTKLTALFKEKTINRKRSDINSKYVYWIGKEPQQIKHKLLLTELYTKLAGLVDEIECTPEFTKIPGIRPDGYIKIKFKGRAYLFFVEIQIANTPTDIQKYESALKNNSYFPAGVFPSILVVTDKNVSASRNLKIIKIGTELEFDISKLL